MLKLIECPRDAMQGWHHLIPTSEKIAYLNALLKVGFDTIDFGSFVSPKAIPQMADTREVVGQLDLSAGSSKLLAIVANVRGAEEAVTFEEISYLGFPFSVSETFQLRNTNKTIAESLEQVDAMQELCIKNRKELVIYISMGFGNPYGEPYSPEIVLKYVEEMVKMDIGIVSLADTVGVADPVTIANLFKHLVPAYPGIEIGAHFHAAPNNWKEKIMAAYNNGCKRFDSAMKGIGGCPMAKDELVGNLATENMIAFCQEQNEPLNLDEAALLQARQMADMVFRN
ncbi:hydroxymethylglutaryl-CoA lyase [Chitinophaga terrae (ex Kim and Jung 2007)]|uniref:Hydroxymethylglutaryl-CoA lyase n=1 Tax=Chitinophaga terrae (ex Kim and Jung 2007) TaxID=408074 RepID=A0A1H4GE22_9BACT|nr:hydroxymethylglutaryl-CoA lyase [Chitinophaga terrae (ex Kim and Jung 2007)]MDQ0110000.1 hydroxymethylglutaryl-CoA lyase [Chitinophaga terrae (ex Kim and Jung 2007)]GEP93388.1 hydroxymethylglutaryl-CoA lyase [Chitinophaga terrae (ex Kim and Jung 2007)]SEB07859.1 hydroxymethylglutaryl-CoA lyase [Chitinophaga terrae (ex Kim and Jung 2007)]